LWFLLLRAMPGHGVGDRRVLPAQPILKTHKGLAKALSGYLLELDNNLLTKPNPPIEGVSRMQQTTLGVWSNVLVRATGAHLCIRGSGVMAAAGYRGNGPDLSLACFGKGIFYEACLSVSVLRTKEHRVSERFGSAARATSAVSHGAGLGPLGTARGRGKAAFC
jgi:hypothetical protein